MSSAKVSVWSIAAPKLVSGSIWRKNLIILFVGKIRKILPTGNLNFWGQNSGGLWFGVGGLFIKGCCGGLWLFKVWVSVSMSRIMPPY